MSAAVQNTSTAASTASVTTLTVSLPTGWAQNDVLYLFCSLAASLGTITAPAGYTTSVANFRGATSTSSDHAVFYKVLTASESDPAPTCTSGRFAITAVLVRGADTTTVEDGVTPTTDINTGETFGNIIVPAITPNSADTLLLRGYAIRNGNNGATSTFTSGGTGMTIADQTATVVAATSEAGVMAAWKSLTGTGAEASVTGTWTGTVGVLTGGAMGSSIIVKSAAAAATAPVNTPTFNAIPFMR